MIYEIVEIFRIYHTIEIFPLIVIFNHMPEGRSLSGCNHLGLCHIQYIASIICVT